MIKYNIMVDKKVCTTKKKTCRIYHLVQLVWYKSCVCWGRVLFQLLPVTYIWIKADPIYNSSSKIFYKSLA